MRHIKTEIDESVSRIAAEISIDLETACKNFCTCNDLEPEDCIIVQYLPVEAEVRMTDRISFTTKYKLFTKKDYESIFGAM